MLNNITIQGRFCRDPELRHTPNGVSVASFTLACERDIKNKESGERETDFIDFVAWRHTAEFVTKYFYKGNMAVVVGRLQLRDWVDKEGNKRRSAEIVADNVYFCDSKNDNSGNSQGSYSTGSTGAYQSTQSAQSTMSDFTELDIDDDDLPF